MARFSGMNSRYGSDQSRLTEFTSEVLVTCPRCSRCAIVRMTELSNPVRHGPLVARKQARVTCVRCGYNACRAAFVLTLNAPRDPVFRLPVWLQTSCCGHTLWAYNEHHLSALGEYVGAKLRERRADSTTGWSNRSWTSRLPRWLSAGKNREHVLRSIAYLKNQLSSERG